MLGLLVGEKLRRSMVQDEDIDSLDVDSGLNLRHLFNSLFDLQPEVFGIKRVVAILSHLQKVCGSVI